MTKKTINELEIGARPNVSPPSALSPTGEEEFWGLTFSL